MTNQQHPITPPPELGQKCWDELRDQTQVLGAAKAWDKTIALAYQAGADMELEACCDVLIDKCFVGHATLLREWRRPKPPSLKEQALKEQALKELQQLPIDPEGGITFSALETIRRALEALPND